MASHDHPNPNQTTMYPQVMGDTAPDHPPSSSLYPTVDMRDLLENLFPDGADPGANAPSAPPESIEETLIAVPGAILHLIDRQYSVELATGDLQIYRIRQGDNTVAVFAAVSDEIQWPLTKDLAAVKLDSSHYFFSFRPPSESQGNSSSSDEECQSKKKNKKTKKKKKKVKDKVEKEEESEVLSYGLTIVSKGREQLLKELDLILDSYSNFSVRTVEEKSVVTKAGEAAREITASELESDQKKKEEVEGKCAAYWTTLAPNVEEYSGTAARLIAAGSGQLVKGILWCGDVTMDRLKWGNEILKQRMAPGVSSEIDPSTLRRIKRVKRVTKMTEKVATGVLSGVVKVSGYFTGSVANSKVGKKFFNLLPGEMVLASLDGFSRIFDAVEVAGKNVMSTSSTVTTGLVSHRYGEEAAKATSEGLDAAGHAVGTAWAVFKIRKALNPQSAFKPTALAKSAAKSAAAEMKAKRSK
ncbi:senescence/dehydration-associated protein-related [Striga asiatica]|uniref:Senescence/dehydration-associated protein-related n=1 Tax=Striga asiatica TaxID=4170 RepID=A0A5A7RA70_STRAF|nr:senescence/dehydration-associated protein-related [Striga asiatica]